MSTHAVLSSIKCCCINRWSFSSTSRIRHCNVQIFAVLLIVVSAIVCIEAKVEKSFFNVVPRSCKQLKHQVTNKENLLFQPRGGGRSGATIVSTKSTKTVTSSNAKNKIKTQANLIDKTNQGLRQLFVAVNASDLNERNSTKQQHHNKIPTTQKPIMNKKQQSISGKNNNQSLREDPGIMFLMRLLFLTYYGSLGSLMPYLPVYYDSIGHGGQVIGLLGAVKPLTTFLVAPAWGILSDSIQRPFQILQVTFLVSLVGQLLVPVRHDATFLTVMIFITALFNAPVKSLLDSMVMDQLHDPSASYGRLRLWGQLGFGLGSSGVGMLLSKSTNKGSSGGSIGWDEIIARPWVQTNISWKSIQPTIEFLDKVWQSLSGYKLLFLVHGLLSIPTWICIQVFQNNKKDLSLVRKQSNGSSSGNDNKKNKKNNRTNQKVSVSTMEGMRLIVQNADVMLFFFLVFVVGVSSGVIENFAYVRMREVGGTGKAMGLSRLVSSLAGAPMFWFSGPLTEALGADRVLVLSLLSYVVRFIIYASMSNPYHGLPAEALRGVTFAAFWSTGTVYAHRVSPPGMQATMLMFLNAMYGGLGQSLGSIIGGKLQHRFGTVQTFLYAAAFDTCFVTLVIMYLSLSKEDSSFKNPKPMEASRSK